VRKDEKAQAIAEAQERRSCIEEARGSRKDEIQSCREAQEGRAAACRVAYRRR
jgi:ribosomal protein L20